jgi:hypothetical protein
LNMIWSPTRMCAIHFGHKKSDIFTSFINLHCINKLINTFVFEVDLRVQSHAELFIKWGMTVMNKN